MAQALDRTLRLSRIVNTFRILPALIPGRRRIVLTFRDRNDQAIEVTVTFAEARKLTHWIREATY